MAMSKSALSLVVLLAALQLASGMLCYGFKKDQTEALDWVFCPSTSCYTVTDLNIQGQADSRRGCADKTYEDTCQKAHTISPSETVCFCNDILCNISGAGTSTLALPLLILPYFLHNFL